MSGLPCFDRVDQQSGKKLTGLVDTGATNNYITEENTRGGKIFHLKKPILVETIHGQSKIDRYVRINIFSHNLVFFIVEFLGKFDILLGFDGLRKINAVVDTMSLKLIYSIRNKIQSINYSLQNNVDQKIKHRIHHLMTENNNTPTLPFNTKVRATIRTTCKEPIWTKSYAYPMICNTFVNGEIEKLRKNGIIRVSHSPYNSPLWVVPKKGLNEDGTPKQRLVIDYSKVNSYTVFDRYPMPDVKIILSNLGDAKYFSKIDLESGYHQILMQEGDIEKTAFSVNGAKYEFLRLPFGLKNAPSIFQRAIDDVLRKFIGKFAYVYMDDIIIFSKTKEEHLEHLSQIIQALTEAHMRISSEKSFFFWDKIEFLGHIVSHSRISVDPKKIETIENYCIPSTLRELRGFLGLSGYYRRFVQNYADIVKPLTLHLAGEKGRVGKKMSAKTKIELDENACEAFNLIRAKLREQIELFQPDFSKPFELTTDASNVAIGAVLSQNDRPITFISRTLNETERRYATNERELLAIIWSLQTLRNYLYGIADLTIFTDHQPLAFAVTEKNPNLKIKRWKSLIDGSGAKIRYKPGKQNIVADALSRQYCNFSQSVTSDSDSIHSSPSSPEIGSIRKVSIPLNFYKRQFILEESHLDELRTETIFSGYVLHRIKFTNIQSLIRNIKLVVDEKRLNAIYTTEEIFYRINRLLLSSFTNCTFIFTTQNNRNITDSNEQHYLVITEHERAHRNYNENYKQLKEQYFFPKMKRKLKAFAMGCEICKKHKYDTHPEKQFMESTPIPSSVGEYIQIDIFHAGNKIYYSTIDRFSKFVLLRHADNKLNAHEVVEEILQFFPLCKHVMTDNEAIFNSFLMKSLFKRMKIEQTLTAVNHSTTNAQVERFHRTIIEISRCLSEQRSLDFSDVILESVREYNSTIHSVTQARPIDLFFHPENFPKVSELLRTAQESMLKFQNKNRRSKYFEPGEIVYAKNNRRDKRQPTHLKHVVKNDIGVTIVTERGKLIHKDNIRN